MKYEYKQKKRQNMCRRAMKRENYEISLLHERALLKNFTMDSEREAMYNLLMENRSEDGHYSIEFDDLDSVTKKLYKAAHMYIMWEDYCVLVSLEMLLNAKVDQMNKLPKEQQGWYDGEYVNLKRAYSEAKKQMIECDKKLYYKCVHIANLD